MSRKVQAALDAELYQLFAEVEAFISLSDHKLGEMEREAQGPRWDLAQMQKLCDGAWESLMKLQQRLGMTPKPEG